MPFRDDRDHIDREILDIIPERFDADPDSHYARKTALIRTILILHPRWIRFFICCNRNMEQVSSKIRSATF